MLAPGGRLIIQVPNLRSIWARWALQEDIPRHLHFYSPRTLRAYAERHGLELERVTHTTDLFGGSGRGVLRLGLMRALGRSVDDFFEVYRTPARERFRRWPCSGGRVDGDLRGRARGAGRPPRAPGPHQRPDRRHIHEALRRRRGQVDVREPARSRATVSAVEDAPRRSDAGRSAGPLFALTERPQGERGQRDVDGHLADQQRQRRARRLERGDQDEHRRDVHDHGRRR